MNSIDWPTQRINAFFKGSRNILLLVILLGMLPGAMLAQMTGTISGTVYDISGAVVPKTKVTLQNPLNGSTRTAISNNSGYFTVAAVAAGTYRLRIEAGGGFKEWVSRPITLHPGDAYDISDIRLGVASSTDTVTVEATDSEVRVVNSGERSAVITADDLKDLSVQGRNATELVKMLPGFAVYSLDNQVENKPGYKAEIVGFTGPAGAFSSNGTGTDAVSLQSDGADVMNPTYNSGSLQNINIDMVQEVKVQTSNFSADTAKGPVVINAVGKSGSSRFHGAGYLYNRNGALNSNDWEANNLNSPKPADSYWYPGGNFGGPIRIPGTRFNQGRDKLFFFTGFEYYRQTFPTDLLQTFTPTANMRKGDFSAAGLADICGPATVNGGQLFCQVPSYQPDGTPIINGNISSLMDPSGLSLLNLMPQPNSDPATTSGGYNYTKQVIQSQNGWQFHARIDYNINDANKVFVTYNRQTQLEQAPVNLLWTPVGSAPYPGNVSAQDSSHTISANYVRVLSATLTNELVGAFTYFNMPWTLGNKDAVSRSKLGYAHVGIFDNKTDIMPSIVDWVNGGYPNMLMPGGFESGSVYTKNLIPVIQDNLSKMLGKHFIKAGIFFEDTTNDQIQNGGFVGGTYSQGQLQFYPWTFEYGSLGAKNNWNGCSTATPVCFNPVAQLLMGTPDAFTQANKEPRTNLDYKTVAFYGTDSWKVGRKLTLDFGLRFEHLSPWTDKAGIGVASWHPELYANDVGTVALPGMRWHGNDKSVSNSGVSVPLFFVEPRFGIAYDVFGTGNTILRGGWGSYRYHESDNDYAGAISQATGAVSMTVTGELNLAKIDQMAPTTFVTPDIDAYAVNPHDHDQPVTNNYNFTVSQRMPLKSLLEVAYVGNDTSHQLLYQGLANINNIPLGTLLNVVPAGCKDATCLTQHGMDQYRPYPYYHTLHIVGHGAYSNYNGLQANWTKQAGSIIFGVNYTYSKTLAVGGGGYGTVTNPFSLRDNYNPPGYDRTQAANANYAIDFGSHVHSNKLLEGAANGWMITGISGIQSGPPLNSSQGIGGNFAFGGSVTPAAGQPGSLSPTLYLGTPDVSLMPTVTCNPTSGLKTGYDPHSRRNDPQFINQACFGIPQIGQNGPFRTPYMRGPAYLNSDLSLFKNFKFGEKMKLQFRLAAFNFLNHPLTSFNKADNSNIQLKYRAPLPGDPQNVQYVLSNPGFGYADVKFGRRVTQLGVKYEF